MSRIGTASVTAVAVVFAFAFPQLSHAVLLDTAFGGAQFKDTSLGGTTVAARPELVGAVVADVSQPFSVPALNIAGNVQSRVVRETVAGTLDFYWRVTVDQTSTGGGVAAFRLTDFGFSNITDGDWTQDSIGSSVPRTARVFNPTGFPTGSVNFLFSDPIVLPGNPASNLNGSHFFFLHTAATQYSMSATYDLIVGANQTLSPLFPTFAPAQVPEPTATLLALLGLAGSASVRRRKRVNT